MVYRLALLVLWSMCTFADSRVFTEGDKASFENHFVLDKTFFEDINDGYLTLSVHPQILEEFERHHCLVSVIVKYVPQERAHAGFLVSFEELRSADIVKQMIGIHKVESSATITIEYWNVSGSCAESAFQRHYALSFKLDEVL